MLKLKSRRVQAAARTIRTLDPQKLSLGDFVNLAGLNRLLLTLNVNAEGSQDNNNGNNGNSNNSGNNNDGHNGSSNSSSVQQQQQQQQQYQATIDSKFEFPDTARGSFYWAQPEGSQLADHGRGQAQGQLRFRIMKAPGPRAFAAGSDLVMNMKMKTKTQMKTKMDVVGNGTANRNRSRTSKMPWSLGLDQIWTREPLVGIREALLAEGLIDSTTATKTLPHDEGQDVHPVVQGRSISLDADADDSVLAPTPRPKSPTRIKRPKVDSRIEPKAKSYGLNKPFSFDLSRTFLKRKVTNECALHIKLGLNVEDADQPLFTGKIKAQIERGPPTPGQVTLFIRILEHLEPIRHVDPTGSRQHPIPKEGELLHMTDGRPWSYTTRIPKLVEACEIAPTYAVVDGTGTGTGNSLPPGFRINAIHHLHPSRVGKEDFVDWSDVRQPAIYFVDDTSTGTSSTNPSNNLNVTSTAWKIPGYYKTRSSVYQPFPVGTRGHLYAHPDSRGAAAHFRFRVASATPSTPCDFHNGHDLLLPSGLPWKLSIPPLLRDGRVPLLRETLIREGIMTDVECDHMCATITQEGIRPRFRVALEEPFDVSLAAISTEAHLAVGEDCVPVLVRYKSPATRRYASLRERLVLDLDETYDALRVCLEANESGDKLQLRPLQLIKWKEDGFTPERVDDVPTEASGSASVCSGRKRWEEYQALVLGSRSKTRKDSLTHTT